MASCLARVVVDDLPRQIRHPLARIPIGAQRSTISSSG